MRSRLPPDTRQEIDLFAGLGPSGLITLAGGAMVGYWVLRASGWPLGLKIPGLILDVAGAIAFAFGRWPPADYGDRAGVWLARIMAYWLMGDRGPWRAVGPDDDKGGV
jgi:hypothetical protein